MDSLTLTLKIAEILDNKKAEDIKALCVKEMTSIADYFVIASANNIPQAKALCDEVEEKLSSLGRFPKRIEGYQTASWVLLDYSDVLVHIFLKDTRNFYSLERLWSDAQPVDLAPISVE